MEDQRVLHYFISSVNNFAKPLPVEVEIEHEEEERVTDPLLTNYGQPENQTNILVQIAEAEEIEIVETALAMEAFEETVTYTDPMGNTFEAPVIDVVDLNRETQMSVIVVESEDTEEDFAFDFSDEDDDEEAFF
jgi:hypothetical protein